MKIAGLSLLALLTPASSVQDWFAEPEEPLLRGASAGTYRELQSSGCYSKYQLTLTTGCDWPQLKTAMQRQMNRRSACRGRTPEDEVRYILDDRSMSAQEVAEYVNKVCVAAFDNDKLFNGFSLDEIFGELEGDPVEFFNGRGPINSRRETSTTKFGNTIDNVANGCGAKFKAIQNNYQSKYPFPFPGEGKAKAIPNFDNCQYNTVMCCWSQDRQAGDNNGNCVKSPAGGYDTGCDDADPADNTDICLVNMSDEPTSAHGKQHGFAVYPGDPPNSKPGEGAMHCHGFAWGDDDTDISNIFKGNNLGYVSLYDHVFQRGYVSAVPGAPQCACIEKMPVVSRSDCTEINKSKFNLEYTLENGKLDLNIKDSTIAFAACKGLKVNNDLEDYYKRLVKEKRVKDNTKQIQYRLVGKGGCPKAIDQFFVKLFIGEVGNAESEKVQQRAIKNGAADSGGYNYSD